MNTPQDAEEKTVEEMAQAYALRSWGGNSGHRLDVKNSKADFLAGHAAALSKLREAHDWGYSEGYTYGFPPGPNDPMEKSFAEFQKSQAAKREKK